jgi:hypothetical protein
MIDLTNIPAPVDAVDVDEWLHHDRTGVPSPVAIRSFHVAHYHVPAWDDDDDEFDDTDETIVAIDGFQQQDGSTFRHIKLSTRSAGEDEVYEAARFLPSEARKVALRLLHAAEQIEQTEGPDAA